MCLISHSTSEERKFPVLWKNCDLLITERNTDHELNLYYSSTVIRYKTRFVRNDVLCVCLFYSYMFGTDFLYLPSLIVQSSQPIVFIIH